MSVIEQYTYRVTWSVDDAEFVGLCSEFPSLSHLAKSQEAALAGIRKVVGSVVEDLRKRREPVPDALATSAYSGELRVRLPRPLHKSLAIEAHETGRSLNRVIVERLIGGPSAPIVPPRGTSSTAKPTATKVSSRARGKGGRLKTGRRASRQP